VRQQSADGCRSARVREFDKRLDDTGEAVRVLD
jgi:hypothetical protein